MAPKKTSIDFNCLTCHEEEKIPYDIVWDFDLMDEGDPITPPQFHCEQFGGKVYPE